MKLKVFTYGDDAQTCFDLLEKEIKEKHSQSIGSDSDHEYSFSVVKLEDNQYYMECRSYSTWTRKYKSIHVKIKVVKHTDGGQAWYNMSLRVAHTDWP